MKPFDLTGLKTYELQSRPSKVFLKDLGHPIVGGFTPDAWLDSLPQQLAANGLRRVCDHLTRANSDGKTIVAAIGGHVIKTGCGPYLIDWIQAGLIKAVVMNGSAAIHDFELAFAGKTSEDVAAQLPGGHFGMASETADAFALASHRGTVCDKGLGQALGEYIDEIDCPHGDVSVLRAAIRAGIPVTIHVAIGTDIVHMHPHVSGAALGESSHIDFRKLCSIVASMADGVWLNIGSAVVLPEVFLKAVAVVRNFGHPLDNLVTVNLDKESRYRTLVNVLFRPAAEGIELIGHHEILIPLIHSVIAARLASAEPMRPRLVA
jgi:hypothetical protein